MNGAYLDYFGASRLIILESTINLIYNAGLLLPELILYVSRFHR